MREQLNERRRQRHKEQNDIDILWEQALNTLFQAPQRDRGGTKLNKSLTGRTKPCAWRRTLCPNGFLPMQNKKFIKKLI